MPEVARIDGIRVELYFDEHPPRHFHAIYAEYRAMIRIDNMKIIKGSLPRAQYRKIFRWASTRKAELDQAWFACQSDMAPGKIR